MSNGISLSTKDINANFPPNYKCCVLTSDQAKHVIPKTAEVVYSIGVDGLGWQYGTRIKSHGTITNWCTWRGWPLNCMTIISARWWSKNAVPKTAEVSHSVDHLWEEIEWTLNYYITQCTGNSMSFLEIRELETRCGRESQHPAEGTLRSPIGSLGIIQLEKWCCSENNIEQRAGPLGLRLNNHGEQERHTAMSGGTGEVNMLQALFSFQLRLTHNPFK